MSGLKNGDVVDSRYQTPESFRTRGFLDLQKPPDSARSSKPQTAEVYQTRLPIYREQEPPDSPRRSIQKPTEVYQNRLQIYREQEPPESARSKPQTAEKDQNRLPIYKDQQEGERYRMSNQVFGSSQPNLMEHNMAPYATQYRYPQQDAYEMSPRRPAPEHYEDRTYRHGRPDIGPERESYVPYPQEPMHRRRPDPSYMQPPKIGHEDQNGPENKAKGDMSLEDGGYAHPGWLVLMRFHKDGLDQVQRALYMCQKHIVADGGKILGLARPYGVRVREGGDNWVAFGRLRYMVGANNNESNRNDDTNYCVLVIYYPSLTRATQWWDRDPSFKQKDFPKPYCSDCIALPLTTRVDTGYNKTLVLTEYPKIGDAEYFRDNFAIPTENMMMKRFKALPYVVKSTYISVDDTRHRVAHHLRGCWMQRNAIITASMFDSLQETYRYFGDAEYNACKKYQDRVTSRHAPTVVVLDLEDWRPFVPTYGQ